MVEQYHIILLLMVQFQDKMVILMIKIFKVYLITFKKFLLMLLVLLIKQTSHIIIQQINLTINKLLNHHDKITQHRIPIVNMYSRILT